MQRLTIVACATIMISSVSCKGVNQEQSSTKIVTGDERKAYSEHLKLMDQSKLALAALVERDEVHRHKIAALKEDGYTVNYLNKIDWRDGKEGLYELAFSLAQQVDPKKEFEDIDRDIREENVYEARTRDFDYDYNNVYNNDVTAFYLSDRDRGEESDDLTPFNPRQRDLTEKELEENFGGQGQKIVRVRILLDKPFRAKDELKKRAIKSVKVLEAIDVFAALR